MSRSTLGKTLVIANPYSHSGAGQKAAAELCDILEHTPHATDKFNIRYTRQEGDAELLVDDAAKYDTVLAVGGDGVIHDCVSGLMKIARGTRPTLGVIATGTGNDYARTLGLPRNNPRASIAQILECHTRRVEVGQVNGVYFNQTLSFGLDAAIAIDTTKRRAEGDAYRGTALFVSSGLKTFSRGSSGWRVKASFDGAEPIETQEIIFAVQIGPSYGAGFKICPEAKPNDGILDVCYNTTIPNIPKLLKLFVSARNGRHVKSPVVTLCKAHTIDLEFETEPPAQVDGERLLGSNFHIEVIPDALQVFTGPTITW